MSRIHVEAERVIDAKPETIFDIMADYSDKHQRILPPRTFRNFVVEKGGQGAGTVIRFTVRAGGRERPYHMKVSEMEKGRVLRETDMDSSLVTTFRVVPLLEGKQTRVRIVTEWEGAKGVGGFFERTFAPAAMRRIYNDELERLSALATS